ncbi:hypothetical protein KCV07_g448, partial [Aureobasidium melanogenum]
LLLLLGLLLLGLVDGHVLHTLNGVLHAIDGTLDGVHCAITGGGVKSCKSAGGGDLMVEKGRRWIALVRCNETAGRSRGKRQPLVTTAARQHIQQESQLARYRATSVAV